MTVVNAEGRHYLSSRNESFDVIQLSGVDSYSGTPGAAHVFSENYLYTAEAFDLYLSRLSENGVMNMMRLEHKPQREMLRALTTAVAALRRLGIQQPRNHIVTLTENSGAFTALLVKRTPFDSADLACLHSWLAHRPSFSVSAEPGSNVIEKGNSYQAFLSLGDEKLERAFIAQYPFAVGPTSDDRPFFFNFAYFLLESDNKGVTVLLSSDFPLESCRLVPDRKTMKKPIDPHCRAFQTAIDVLARPWTGLLLGLLDGGPLRFGELEERAHGLGAKTLSARLKDLEARGLLDREVEPGPPVRVRYTLTARGRAFGQVAEAIQRWGGDLVDGEAPASEPVKPSRTAKRR